MQHIISDAYESNGYEVNVYIDEDNPNWNDPSTIIVEYPSAIKEQSEYILPRIKIEVSSRGLTEPFTDKPIQSLIGEWNENEAFSDSPILIPTVNVERTFLEKLFLLHEEFQRPEDRIRTDRLSRHIYDIYHINKTPFCSH